MAKTKNPTQATLDQLALQELRRNPRTKRKNPTATRTPEQERNIEIATNIKRQIHFGVWLSIGARDPLAIDNGLQIKVGGRSLWYQITLNPRDYYDIELIRANIRTGRTVLWRGEDIPVENMNDTLIRMLDSTNRKRAGGKANPTQKNPLGSFKALGTMCPDCDQPMAVPENIGSAQVRCPHCKGVSRARSNPSPTSRPFVTVTSSGRAIVTSARTARQASSIVRTNTGEEVVASDSLDEVTNELVDRNKLAQQIQRRNPGSAIVSGLAFGLGGYIAQVLGDAARDEAEKQETPVTTT